MSNIDEKLALMCGAIDELHSDGFWIEDKYFHFKWTIEDARCREIVLDHAATELQIIDILNQHLDQWMLGNISKKLAEKACCIEIASRL